MRSANEKKMLSLLLDEIEDTLQEVELRFLKLTNENFASELEYILRAAHNIKGAAQLYGLNDYGATVHLLEDFFNALSKHKNLPNDEINDIVPVIFSNLNSWTNSIREDSDFVFDFSKTRQLLQRLTELAQRPETLNNPDSNPKKSELTGVLEKNNNETNSPVNSEINSKKEMSRNRTSPMRVRKPKNTLRIASEKIDEVMQLIGQISIYQEIINHNLQSANPNILTCQNAANLNLKTLKSLYEVVLTLRMQPADSLFQRLERTARDLARDQRKKLIIELFGTDTPIDKTIIELISDPLMHIVRNAIDHGIEEEQDRLNAGKKSTAKLSVFTYQESGRVIIKVSDNGRGLNTSLIRKKAESLGLIHEGQKLSETELHELIFTPGFSTRDLITEISGRGIGMDIVKNAIEQIGGRIDIISKLGVGTSFLLSLPASLEIIDALLIRLGDQMFLIPRLEIDEIIDIENAEIESRGFAVQAIRHRKAVIPLEPLARCIGLDIEENSASSHNTGHSPQSNIKPSANSKDASRNMAVVILLSDGSRLALKIDTIVKQLQIVVRPLSEKLSSISVFSGATVLGNGDPALILSMRQIGEQFQSLFKNTNNISKNRATA